jgi:hypothetical protein
MTYWITVCVLCGISVAFGCLWLVGVRQLKSVRTKLAEESSVLGHRTAFLYKLRKELDRTKAAYLLVSGELDAAIAARNNAEAGRSKVSEQLRRITENLATKYDNSDNDFWVRRMNAANQLRPDEEKLKEGSW